MRNKQVEIKGIYLLLLVFFGIFLLFPSVMMVAEALKTDQGLGVSNFSGIIFNRQFLTALINSFTVSAVSAVITVILAGILAYTVHYTNIPGWLKSAISMLSIFPMLLPTMTYGFAIIYSFGKQGLLTKIFGMQFFDLYGFKGLVMGYVIYTLPIAFLLISNTLHYVDKKFITVSKLMGDHALKTFFVTTIRPIVGTLGAAFVQSFFLSFTDFGIPSAIGGNYEVVATTLYNTMLGSVPDFGSGAVVAIMMIIPSILSIALLSYLDRFNFRYDKVSDEGLSQNRWRDMILGSVSSLLLLSVIAVFAVIFIIPFTEMWPYKLTFTLSHFTDVLNKPQLFYIYRNSVVVAILTGSIGTLLAYGAALVTQRSELPEKLTKVIDSIALIINTIPGMVLGIAFLFAFTGTSLQNTMTILIVSNIIHFFSTPYLMMKNSLSKMNSSWETTAMLMGDSWLKTVIRVVTPNAKNTILEVFEYYFINSMVTISAVIFLAGARTMIITSKIKELQYMAKFDQIFVYSILILVTNLAVKLIVKFMTRKRRTLK